MPAADAARRPLHRTGFSVRTRIVATVALLVAAALAGAGLTVHAIESRRVADDTTTLVEQELEELARLSRGGIDPDTDQAYDDVTALLRSFLERTVPSEDELLVGWVGDAPVLQTPARDDITRSRAFADAVRPLLAEGGSTRTTAAGEDLFVTVQPVRQGDSTGALVVVVLTDVARAGLRETMRTYTGVAVLALLVVVGVAAWQSGRLLRPVRTLRAAAEEIGSGDLSRRIPVSGNDDLTALTLTVNHMLERLEDAFGVQRRFLDDAGHELRTPLTVVRGHLELLDPSSRDDVTTTRDLVVDEVDRMTRLVQDLIDLAKSDRPDFLTPAEVDPVALVTTVHAKAQALGDRDWRLEVPDTDAPVRLLADEQRLTQLLLQLADNAVKHTGVDDFVALGCAVEPEPAPGRVRLWVRDSGPGVPEEDRETVFERFGRSEVGADDDGFGLGLSIVAAIVRAHGGTVTLTETHPGERYADRPGAHVEVVLSAQPDPTSPEETRWPGS